MELIEQMPEGRVNNSLNVSAIADTEEEVISVLLCLTERNIDIYFYHTPTDPEPYTIIPIRD